MSDETKKNSVATANGGLPADMAKALLSGIAASPLQQVGSGGKPFLKMNKDGSFTFGPENDEVDPEWRWAVNPTTFGHGWVCWAETVKGQKPEKLGEKMVSMTQPMPEQPDPIKGQEFTKQGSFELRGLEGDAEGIEIAYITPSNGGLQAIKAVTEAFQRHYPEDPMHPCPVVTMTSTSYQHPTYGKIWKPVFEVVAWCDMDGNLDDLGNYADPEVPADESDPLPEQPDELPKSLKRAGRPRLAPAPDFTARTPQQEASRRANERTVEPVQTARAHVGQRRRPTV